MIVFDVGGFTLSLFHFIVFDARVIIPASKSDGVLFWLFARASFGLYSYQCLFWYKFFITREA